jgi:hypothetical protein
MNNFEEITITLHPDEAAVLVDSLSWSLQATERAIDARPDDPKPRAKWEALDSIFAQVQEVKRDRWYGKTA